MSDTNSTLEILVNLIYLARHSTDDPKKLIEYLDHAEKHVWQLAEILKVPPAVRRRPLQPPHSRAS